MKTAVIKFESVTPISFSKALDEVDFPKKNKERPDQYDMRLWKEKAHYGEATGDVVIPGEMFRKAVIKTAKKLRIKVGGGKGNTEYHGYFICGILCWHDIPIGTNINEIKPVKVFCHSNGVKGSGSRVYKRFPIIDKWAGTATFNITHDGIGQETFLQHVKECGRLEGLGRWRIGVGGQFGMFKVTDFSWQDDEDA